MNSELDESVTRIQELHQAEKKLVQLVETAGEALAVLTDDGPSDEDAELAIRERIGEFTDLANKYFSLVNDIQLTIRQQVHFLTQTASLPSTTKTIPFRLSVAGEQKELEIWTNALTTLQQRMEDIKRIPQA
ncbi:uncharacterized protein BX664DRAFT_328640 [Halteromyces radiatus]|uniref:uncharacterized protein n=1 Tax=Halteromyces radiatus TaxID=101107 RepID=UPI00221FDFFE|nr:uncharacterized protein BX664DRAFT_328640 [Halteromyces radiatus]KAI8092979.1 hypothetical protein BX664DRAFT_328640 [Halteromyces radiatus]